jgi:dTDP-4-dehydrorhamnose 3,5-epimerase-like enzyme
MQIVKIPFPTHTNDTGSLSFFEAERHIPFPIRRIYYIFNVASGARRGFHAHKNLKQVLFCIHGSCKLLLDDGKEQQIVHLTNPSEGILLEGVIWREMYDFSDGAVLAVMASEYYDEADYIRNYEDFLSYIKGE